VDTTSQTRPTLADGRASARNLNAAIRNSSYDTLLQKIKSKAAQESS
jgi:hypothetical protein